MHILYFFQTLNRIKSEMSERIDKENVKDQQNANGEKAIITRGASSTNKSKDSRNSKMKVSIRQNIIVIRLQDFLSR